MKSSKIQFLAIIVTMALITVSGFAQGQVIYSSIPETLPGNFVSIAYQANQAEEFGDQVQFASGGRSLIKVTQTMSSWGCEGGAWYAANCATTPGATFSHPITLNIYSVGVGNSVGPLLHTVTQTFDIPYRPSASPSCGDGRWSDGVNCFNGLATNITFNLNNLAVPNQVIYSIAYNTSNYGSAPMGPTACSATFQGCGYDSLNVAVDGGAPTVGVNPAPDDAYFSTETAGNYCDGGIGGTDVFRLDAGCWTGYKPVVRFTTSNVPTNANQCKNSGWQTRTRLDGTTFRNQGQCNKYVNTGS